MIVCVTTGKSYVGSSMHSIFKRMTTHRTHLNNNTHHSIKLQRAWNKYGADKFWFTSIEFVAPHLCIEREQYWMNVYKRLGKLEYNIAQFARSNKGLKYCRTKPSQPCSENAKKLLSLRYKGVSKSRTHAMNSGKGHLRAVIQLKLSGEFIAEWAGINIAAKTLNFKSHKISECCRGKKYTSSKGYKWMYKSDYYGNLQ